MPYPEIRRHIVMVLAVAMSVFHLYTGAFGIYEIPIQTAIHLGLAMALILLLRPSASVKARGVRRYIGIAYDVLIAIAALAPLAYRLLNLDYLQSGRFEFVTPATTLEVVLGIALIIAILDLCRRETGWALTLIIIIFLIYPMVPHLPSILAHDGYTVSLQIDAQYLTLSGIFSVPLQASATYIVLFIIFGAFLERSGLGQFVIDFAVGLVGTYRGGPAKVAVLASAMHGTISGSAPANVLTVGVITIPMMRKLGYPAYMAGAIEAAASTGGIIMPPIMGTVAFIMAQFTGIPYVTIALYALIPACLYFFGVFCTVHWSAVRHDIGGLRKEDLPDWRKSFRARGHLVLPLALLLYLMIAGYSPQFAVTWSIAAVIAVSWLRKETRMTWRDILTALENGGKGALLIAIATAGAGMIVGVFELTGVGLKLAQSATLLVDSLIVGMILTMLVTILLGMGVPPSVSYIVQIAVTIPMLQAFLKADGMAADTTVVVTHFFVMYYAALAVLTPPDALASVAAAGLAGAPFLKTGIHATRVAFVAFVVPFMFVFRPALLTLGTPTEIARDIVFAVLGIFITSMGLEGYGFRKLTLLERILALVSGIALIFPTRSADFIGLGLLVVLIALQWAPWRKVAAPE